MAEVIDTPVTNQTSIAELRSMLEPSPTPPVNGKQALTVTQAAPEPEVKAKPETPEVVETEKPARERDEHGKFVPKAGATETESGTVQSQEPEKEVEKEDPLPPNVQKRIAKEVEKQARIDREIAEAVSRTKARQAELEKLKSEDGKSGPEPVKTTAPAKTEGKPTRPVRPVFGEDGQTWGEHTASTKAYDKLMEKYEEDLLAWTIGEARKATAEELAEQRANEKIDRTREEARKEYGAKVFDEACSRVLESATPELVVEIGSIEKWPSIISYLGKSENEAELESLSALYKQNRSAALRELGRIEDRLTKPATKEPSNGTTKEAVKDKPLPPPPERVGGGANAAPKVDLNKLSPRDFNREIKQYLERP